MILIMESLVTIPPLVLQNSLQSHAVYELLVEKILIEVRKIPNLLALKMNVEMTRMVCHLVENTVTKDHKID